jgi:hypothetical protein
LRAGVLGEPLGVAGQVDVVLRRPAPWTIGPAAGFGERIELGVLADHSLDPLARGVVQLLERDLADDPVADVAPGEGGGRPRGPQKASYHAEDAAVHDLLTANVQVEGLGPSYTGTTAMAIVPLPLPPGAEARALLHYLLEHGDVVGIDAAGRTIIKLAVDLTGSSRA